MSVFIIQVITGGNYDVDVELTSESGQSLYKEVKKQYDSYTWTTAAKGEYRICFSNEFSTFTHKLVYFDFKVGEEDSIKSVLGERVTALTQVTFEDHFLYRKQTNIFQVFGKEKFAVKMYFCFNCILDGNGCQS